MLVPLRRGLAESLAPVAGPIERNPGLSEEYRDWQASRSRFLQGLQRDDPEARRMRWQKHYFKGVGPGGAPFDGHQTKLRVKPFSDRT